MQNLDIRMKAKSKGVYLYSVAEAMGISEPTMTRKMRRELPDNEKAKIISIIDELAKAQIAEIN